MLDLVVSILKALSLCQLMNYELLIEYIQGHKSIIGFSIFFGIFSRKIFSKLFLFRRTGRSVHLSAGARGLAEKELLSVR